MCRFNPKMCAYVITFLSCWFVTFELISTENVFVPTLDENVETSAETEASNNLKSTTNNIHASNIYNISSRDPQHLGRPTLTKARYDQEDTKYSKDNLNKHQHSNEKNYHHHSTPHQIHLVNWKWEEYGKILTIALILILAGIIKLGFHHTPILSEYIPESCVIIIIGIGLGAIIYTGKNESEINMCLSDS